MRILLIGKSGMMEDWLHACSKHAYIVREDVDQKFLSSNRFDFVIDLHLENDERKKEILHILHENIDHSIPILSNSVCVTSTEIASWLGDVERVVGLAWLPTFLNADRVEVSFSWNSQRQHLVRVSDFFSSLGKSVEIVTDNIGMVFPRILCMIINEAYFAMEQGVADADAIDTAMKLATNYPMGPVEWGKKLGLKNVRVILQTLHTEFGDDRYRPAPLLKKTSFEYGFSQSTGVSDAS